MSARLLIMIRTSSFNNGRRAASSWPRAEGSLRRTWAQPFTAACWRLDATRRGRRESRALKRERGAQNEKALRRHAWRGWVGGGDGATFGTPAKAAVQPFHLKRSVQFFMNTAAADNGAARLELNGRALYFKGSPHETAVVFTIFKHQILHSNIIASQHCGADATPRAAEKLGGLRGTAVPTSCSFIGKYIRF